MNTPTLSLRRNLSVSKAQNAFSLIELLVVIAIIGIIAAIAIPNIGNLTGSATTAKDQRNAQTLASVSSASLAAGAPLASSGTLEVTALITGVNGTGTMSNASFKVDMEQGDYNTQVKSFLNYNTNTGFSYVKGGGGTAN